MTHNPTVTQPSYSGGVTASQRLSSRSEPRRNFWGASYAIDADTHLPAGARPQARASVRVCMCFLSNYVTQEEEKKEQQVSPTKSGYAGGYAPVTHCVTHSPSLRAEVTHA